MVSYHGCLCVSQNVRGARFEPRLAVRNVYELRVLFGTHVPSYGCNPCPTRTPSIISRT